MFQKGSVSIGMHTDTMPRSCNVSTFSTDDCDKPVYYKYNIFIIIKYKSLHLTRRQCLKIEVRDLLHLRAEETINQQILLQDQPMIVLPVLYHCLENTEWDLLLAALQFCTLHLPSTIQKPTWLLGRTSLVVRLVWDFKPDLTVVTRVETLLY